MRLARQLMTESLVLSAGGGRRAVDWATRAQQPAAAPDEPREIDPADGLPARGVVPVQRDVRRGQTLPDPVSLWSDGVSV